MNKSERAKIWRFHNSFIRKYERMYISKMRKLLKWEILNYNGEPSIGPIYNFLLELYTKVGPIYAKSSYQGVMKQANKKRMPIGFNEAIIQGIINEFRLKLLNESSAEIDSTTRNSIEKALIEGQLQGKGLVQVLNELAASDMPKSRARTILRTELNKAANFAEQLGVDATGIKTNKIWISTRDGRTRDSHIMADGQTVPDGEPFTIRGRYKMQRPGDSTNEDGTKVPPEEIVKCRCVVGREVVR